MPGARPVPAPERIPVLPARVAGPGGTTREVESVHCPPRQRPVGLDACLACPANAGLLEGPGGRHVRCRRLALLPLGRAPVPPPPGGLEAARATPVWQVMSGEVACVRPDLPLPALLHLLSGRRLQSAAVVDDEGRPVGMVSAAGLLRRLGVPHRRAGWLSGLTAADVMGPAPAALPEGASVAEAAAVLAERRAPRLPVLSAEGVVIGVVSAFDLLRWLAARARPAAPAGRAPAPPP